jgi:putative ABC transport system permease protein
MFWRILGQLFSASRGRLAVALLALASGAAVTTALINLNLDAERKVSGEFRTLGASAVMLPNPLKASKLVAPTANGMGRYTVPSDNASSTPLLSESIIKALDSFSKGNDVGVTPFLYIVGTVPVGEAQQQLIIVGTWPGGSVDFAPWWKITGQSIPDINDSTRCLIGVNVARQLNLAPGSPITLHYAPPSGERSASLTVAGVVNSGGQEDSQVIANLKVVQRLAGLEGRIGSIALTSGGPPDKIAWIIARLSSSYPDVDVRAVPQIAQAEASLLPRIRGLIFFMVALILVLTTLCVFASMAALAMERRRDVGLMKAIGGSMSRIVRIFFTEAAALGLAGALIGYVAGIFLSRWIGERAFHVAISARPEVLPIVVALMVGVALAGALPLRLLGNIRPAEILRGE